MGLYYNKENNIYLVPVDEAYVGKTKELKKIEAQLGVIRKKFDGGKYFNDVNYNDDTQDLNKMFENVLVELYLIYLVM